MPHERVVIDSSAIIAILLGEPEAEAFALAIDADSKRLVSAVSFLESSIVIETLLGNDGVARLDLLVAETNMQLVPFTPDDARSARRAYRSFGKGRHPAGLNFGDCASYALSRETGEPLLFKGDDFGRTDIDSAANRDGTG